MCRRVLSAAPPCRAGRGGEELYRSQMVKRVTLTHGQVDFALGERRAPIKQANTIEAHLAALAPTAPGSTDRAKRSGGDAPRWFRHPRCAGGGGWAHPPVLSW